MNKSRAIQVTGALGVALVSLFVAKSFLQPAPPPKASPEVVVKDKVERAKVLTVARKVEMGSPVGAGNLLWTDWPKDMIKPGMITQETEPEAVQKYEKGRARAPLFPGEPIVAGKILTAGEGGFMSALLPKGMRAVAVRVSVETGAGGFIMPNDRVDVLLTRKVHGRTVTDTVLSNVRVLAIDQTYQEDEKGKSVATPSISTATLELEPAQAEVLARVESLGQLTLALRSLAELADSKLGDDGPRLSPAFARKNGGEVKILRYGIPRVQAKN